MGNKKRWFSETIYVDRDTGEVLDKARVERENWIKKNSSFEVIDKGTYNLKKITNEYERNRQTSIEFEAR